MKNILKTVYPLIVISVFFAAALGLTYQMLEGKINDTVLKEEQDALKAVLAGAVTFDKVTNNGDPFYIGYDSQKQQIGYVFKKNKTGYGGPVVMLIGVKNDQTVDKVFVLAASSETPGLGYKCVEKTWLEQFAGLTRDKVPGSKADYVKYDLDVITGATITSMAVANNLKLAFEQLKLAAPVPATNTNLAHTADGGAK
ncbi:MAG: hypothetical protein A2Y33_13560 [Spirochaetes bacterium GWF1_51_8]|nr:MAG: hypothetical protein A2Y33_13560 [Spirochaetes bacterium GWF1_51_8]